MKYKNICVKDGKIWERATLHLKSAIPNFNRNNIAKRIELDLLVQAISLD